MTIDEIENRMEKIINQLKPGIRQKFVYRFTDKPGENLADAVPGLSPVVLTFYSERIRKFVEDRQITEIEDFLKRVLFKHLQTDPGLQYHEINLNKYEEANFVS